MSDNIIPFKGPPIEPDWYTDFRHAVYFIAGHYAAEQVREVQKHATWSGRSLSADEIATIFRAEAKFMVEKISKTAKVSATGEQAKPKVLVVYSDTSVEAK